MPDVAAEQSCDHAPDGRDPRDLERRPRVAVEHELRLPGGGGEASELGLEVVLVPLELAVEDRLRHEPCRHERLVDPVARERVDEPGRVADEQHGAARGAGRPPDRQAPALEVGQLRVVDAVRGAEPLQVRPQPRPFGRPAADAVVRVTRLREDPAVATGDDAELDRRTARLTGRQRPVSLERDPVEDAAAESGVARDPAVDTVRPDDHPSVHGRPADPERGSVRSDR